jgi:type II secretory pathway pseudopilin PulG
MRVLVVVGLLLGACATPRLQSDIQKREEEKLQVLLRRNQELIENIRYYEAKLDTLEKMRSAQVKGLYRVR